MDSANLVALRALAGLVETPAYVYFPEAVDAQIDAVDRVFGEHFGISFAIKSNPNIALLRHLSTRVPLLDASSSGEIERAIVAGASPAVVSFSGPAKRDFELRRAVEVGCGEIVCESSHDLDRLDGLARAAGRTIPALLRVNPARLPAKFGAQMGGRASQFGIDEEEVDALLAGWRWSGLVCEGFHLYSGSNSLSVEALAENFQIAFNLFGTLADRHRLRPSRLILGAGFGIPYHDGQTPLDLAALGAAALPSVEQATNGTRLSGARLTLEMGRYLVGPAGYLLTRVVNVKESRGTRIAMCDAGFNNHLAACGMMGAVIRRNWPIWKVAGDTEGTALEHTLVGPLCTSIDTLGTKVGLPKIERGDVLAIGSSGAYGLSASPTRFISHPEPRELLVPNRAEPGDTLDVTEALRVPAFSDQTLAAGPGWRSR
jgi:diaminopimelate decarboxylase